MESNTPQEQVVEDLDFSSVINPDEKPVEQPVETPVEQPKENEFIIVDGERVEVDLNEVVGQHPDGSPIYLKDTDNPKSYKFFQAKDTKKNEALRLMEEKLKSFEQQLTKPEQSEKLQVPQKPVRPGAKPSDYNIADAYGDPSSPSYQWREKWDSYQEAKADYDDYISSQYEQVVNQTAQEKALAAQKAQVVGEFQKAGAGEEATKVYDWFIAKLAQNDYKSVVNWYRTENGQVKPQTQHKVEQVIKDGQRQESYVLPPGVAPSQPAPQEDDFGDMLIQTVKQFNI